MSGIRFCTNESTLGEPEQDANSALTELDKGLRSNKVGEQCEAIVRFPKLFEKYPFPILINSSFLKLADVFRVGNNFLRLWIVKVFQQCEKHFDKIINVDEFVYRIYSVIYSNDPIARALTLRTLGSVAGIIPERQQVHHSIRSCLDSHNAEEVEAAIFAAEKFAAQSKSFAVSMCNKISDMIHGLTTPVRMKLQLIPILRHMHHDTATALMVRTVCIDLLKNYPAEDFVLVTLKTLTSLAAATYVSIPEQVTLLVHYVVEEAREEIRMAALSCLYDLAKQGSHHWPSKSILQLITVAGSTQSEKLIPAILDIMIILTQSSAICHAYYKPDSLLMSLCYNTSLSSNPVIAGKAVKIITQVVCYCYKENLPELSEESTDCIESYLLFVLCNENRTISDKRMLKMALRNAVDLCKVQRQLCGRFVRLIVARLLQDTGDTNLDLCKTLCALCSLEPQTVTSFLADICSYLEKISSDASHVSETKETLCTLIFQTSTASTNSEDTKGVIQTVINNSTNLWSCYKIARMAARYGNFDICHRIVSKLKDSVSSECYYFWMIALQEISIGEANLRSKNSKQLWNNILKAAGNYSKATSTLKAATTPTATLVFQIEYTRLRAEMLNCFYAVLTTCSSFCLDPPAAVATAITQNTRDELQRYGQITNQLRKRAKEFSHCADMFWKLYQSAFNADPVSLLNIQALQFICAYMAHCVESIALTNQMDDIVLDAELENGPLEIRLMVENCKKVAALKSALNLPPKVIHHNHIKCLRKQTEILVQSPMCLPRFFFQMLQSTTVTLSLTPQPKNLGELILVSCGSQLTLKVDGVLQYRKRPGLWRSINAVILTVNSQLTARANLSHDYKVPADTNIVLTQKVVPQRDFFRADFLLAFAVGGQYQVTVDIAMVDQTEFIWQTGIQSCLNIKAQDETQSTRSSRVTT